MEQLPRGLGRGDQQGQKLLILDTLIPTFSLEEKGLLRLENHLVSCLQWFRSSRDSLNQDFIESFRYVNGTVVSHGIDCRLFDF